MRGAFKRPCYAFQLAPLIALPEPVTELVEFIKPNVMWLDHAKDRRESDKNNTTLVP